MNKKKICILTISLFKGGSERVISLLLKHLIHDYEVTLVLLSDHIEFEIPDAVTVHILGPKFVLLNKPIHDKLKNTVKFIIKYYKIVKRENFDIAMSFLPLPNIINSIIANHVNHKTTHTIVSERCHASKMYENAGFSKRLAKIFYPIFYNKNDKLFSNSVHINEDLKNNYRIKIPMSVIYNPIEISNSKLFNDNYSGQDVFKIINIGRLAPQKNQELILSALRSLDNTYELTILGRGSLTEELKNYAVTHNIASRINMPGAVINVNEYLLESDCFVLSSIAEGFPNVLLEAMAIGVPVIASNCLSGPLEILNDNKAVNIEKGEFYLAKHGILINVNDDVALTKALEYYKTNHKERRKYSDLAYSKARTYDINNIYPQLKQLIEEY